MLKYRRLDLDELQLLEKQFIRFLAAQSITGPDWEKISKEDQERKERLLDEFSNVVIEKTLHNVKILEHRIAKRILFFEFFDEEASLFGIEFEKDPPFSLEEGFELKELAHLLENKDYAYSFLSGTKNYQKDRKKEIFDVMQQGAQIPANNDLFNFVLKIYENSF